VIIYTALSFIHVPTANNFNYVLLIVGLVWIGIPHGALDHLLSTNKKTSIPIFIFKYLFIMIAYLLFWQFFPIISLLVFVAYSSFHFGESELIQNKEELNTLSKYLKAFLFGLSILLFIISTHLEESLRIISTINNASILFPVSLHIQTWSIVISLISLTYILLNCLLSKSLSFIGVLVLLILGVQVPLLMAFGLYFIVQHSYNAWSHLKKGLNMSSRELYLKSSLLTFSALLLFVFMAFFIRESIDLVGFWANFFIFIACISLPHFLLMHRFYLSKKEIK
jgi:Brp/Blh family beta-carotene 15,15'-monooxygenase